MIVLVPTDQLWAKGDRTVGCIVVEPDGRQMTESVRGTAQ